MKLFETAAAMKSGLMTAAHRSSSTSTIYLIGGCGPIMTKAQAAEAAQAFARAERAE
jgi:hypothetical protein